MVDTTGNRTGPIVRSNRLQEHPFDKIEARYREIMQDPLNQARMIGEADIVVGIPFYNEKDRVTHVLETVREGLEKFYPELKAVLVAAGSPAGPG